MLIHLALWLSFSGPAVAQQCEKQDSATASLVERINHRYDDFFQYRRSLEERERAREKGRGENKAHLAAREKAIEKARLEYLRNRRPVPDHEAKFEAEMLRAFKARSAALESARVCYVQSKDRAEKLEKRGRTIPGDKEYDLDQ